MVRKPAGLRIGFTLVEVLAAAAIVAVLIAIALPAVMRARQAVDDLKCCSHLRQLGIAAAAYQSDHRIFPPAGYQWWAHPSFFSPFSVMLPYLEQGGAYNLINFQIPINDEPVYDAYKWHGTAARRRIDVFLCPAEPNARIFPGGSSYRACLGPHSEVHGLAAEGAWRGPFQVFRFVSPADFSDGLSQTAFISERTIGDRSSDYYSPSQDLWYLFASAGDDSLPPQTPGFYRDYCNRVPSSNPPHEAEMGRTWLAGGHRSTWYNHVLTPNHPTPDCAKTDVSIQGEGAITARSHHPGKVNLLMADGSVRPATDSVSQAVWSAIATRDGGEAVDSGF